MSEKHPMSGEFEELGDNPLSYEEHFIAAVREGIEEAERGELYSHEFVKQKILKRLTTDEN
jgi:predicted transcriptional regulator